MQEQFDLQLISAYLKGDEIAFETLILRYLKPIYAFVFGYAGNPQDAEDITQEVFMKVWKNLKKVDSQKSFKSWIYTIAKNASLDFLKKKKAILFSEIEGSGNSIPENITDRSILPDRSAELSGIRIYLESAMGRISEKYRKVLALYYEKYLNFREISEILGESINTVKSRHRRGLILLKEILNK